MLRKTCLLATLVLLPASPAFCEDAPSSSDAVSETSNLVETVLDHHVLPPTRQQMLVAALRKVFADSRQSLPLDLSRQMSDATSPDELRSIMEDHFNRLLAQGVISQQQLAQSMREGLLSALPGDVRLGDAEGERVAEQFRSNRYVGTGIALGQEDGWPVMVQVIPGGPAHSVGALDGDRIEVIDGESTEGMLMKQVIDLLRGQEGSDVVVALRQPDEEEPRVLTITRGVVPLKSIDGYEIFPARDAVVAYVRIDLLSASCVHELDQIREKVERDSAQGLIVDLRETESGRVHDAVLLANAFLDGEEIGRVRTLTGDRTYVAEPGELFPDVKIGLLVGRGTWGTVEWVAAALQDAGRAVVFGEWTRGQAFASEAIPYGHGDQVLITPTALLERPSGQPLLQSGGTIDRDVVTARSFALPHEAGGVEQRLRVPWGVLPDVSLSTQSAQQMMAMPQSAAYQLPTVNPRRTPDHIDQPGIRSSLRRGSVPPPSSEDSGDRSERSHPDD